MIRKIHHSGSVIIILFLLFGLLSACHRQAEQQKSAAEPVKTGITLSEAQIQLANIKVTPVSRGTIGHQLLLSSVLKVDEQSTMSVSSGIAGRIQKLLFKNTGEIVKNGDALYELYSEDLLAVEREYASLENNNWNTTGRFDQSLALENKLLLIGLLPSQIKELQKNRKFSSVVTIYSKTRGTVRSIDVTEGQYVSVGQQLMQLADDNKLWVEAQVYPNELQLLKTGMPVDVIVPVAGDLHIQSSINFINPAFEPGRNVTLIRAIINNPQKKLHPGMLALLSVQGEKSKGIVIPASALLMDKQGTIVWVQQEDGSFASKIVTTGIQTADSVMILSGLKQTEKIVVSGAYLLNSEMILKRGTDPMAKGAL
jgi:Cu(I)/Ag(I) efflux system membrane fusion protein